MVWTRQVGLNLDIIAYFRILFLPELEELLKSYKGNAFYSFLVSCLVYKIFTLDDVHMPPSWVVMDPRVGSLAE